MSVCCSHSYCTQYTDHESGLCAGHRPYGLDNNDPHAVSFFFGVFYEDGDCEWNFLAAFDSREKAEEYRTRQVWQHLKTFVSRQPVY